jgi:hypothetical protein
MKRKYSESFGGVETSNQTIYGAPPLESTMMVDTGSLLTKNDCVGAISSVPINASLASGTRLFQYNQFYWNRDLFTFNFNNCTIMIILSYFDGQTRKTGTMFYAVHLPQTAVSLYQKLQGPNNFSPKIRRQMVDDLLYYLNGMWVPNPVATGVSYPSRYTEPITNGVQFGPIFYTYTTKGFLYNPTNNSQFPFFQFNDKPPPLIWCSEGSNCNIILTKNPAYWNSIDVELSGDDCAFQFVTPYENWTLSTGNPDNLIVLPSGLQTYVNGSQSIKIGGSITACYTNTGNSNRRGWCGRGAFSIGFAQADDRNVFGNYSDLYGTYDNPVLQDLWVNYTTFINKDTDTRISMDGFTFRNFARDHFLSTHSIVAYFIPSFLPSRYIAIGSEILSRDQKAMTISNSPILASPNIMGVEFLSIDNTRTWQDRTISGLYGSVSTSVVHMDPLYSIQSVDFFIYDEFASVIQNFRSQNSGFLLNWLPITTANDDIGKGETGSYLCSYALGENSFILDDSGGNVAKMFTFPIPNWLSAMNPLNAMSVPPPSQQPFMAPFSTYNCAVYYMVNAVGAGQSRNFTQPCLFPPEYSPSLPISSGIIHFGRVLGY